MARPRGATNTLFTESSALLNLTTQGNPQSQSLVWVWVIVGLVAVAAIGVGGWYIWKRCSSTRKGSTHQKGSLVMDLLYAYVKEDQLTHALLPTGSLDFNSESKVIAAGGGGRVYMCKVLQTVNESPLKIGQKVALKEIYSMMSAWATPDTVQEFGKELRVLMQLQHEHIVQFLGVYCFQDQRDTTDIERYFMVTQFAERGSLDGYISSDFVEVPLSRRVRWVREMTLALHYLHREHFVHRDIKPQNVLLDADWRCLLTDFGISRSLLTARTLTTQIGTVQFMPPEALYPMYGLKQDSGSSSSISHCPTASTTGTEVPANGSTRPSQDPKTRVLAEAWDVYSLAILVASIFNRQIDPYPNMRPQQIMKNVYKRYMRPDEPKVLSSEYVQLIKDMWRRDSTKRPSFCQILDRLDRIKQPLSPYGLEVAQASTATATENEAAMEEV